MIDRPLVAAAALLAFCSLVPACANRAAKPAPSAPVEPIAVTKAAPAPAASAAAPETFRDDFNVDKSLLGPTGRGRYWVLEPGRVATYKGGDGETLTITVLDETKVVDGVTTRVVEEREEKNGKLVEVSRNYMAIEGPAPAKPRRSRDAGPEAPVPGKGPSAGGEGAIYYFGEEVDIYKGGKVVSHEGAWIAGEKGARFGLLVPGAAAKPGDRYQQETAPGVAMDRAEVLAIDAQVKTQSRDFENCLHVKETTPLEKGVTHKYYAPFVGLVQDDEFVLVNVTPAPGGPGRPAGR